MCFSNKVFVFETWHVHVRVITGEFWNKGAIDVTLIIIHSIYQNDVADWAIIEDQKARRAAIESYH